MTLQDTSRASFHLEYEAPPLLASRTGVLRCTSVERHINKSLSCSDSSLEVDSPLKKVTLDSINRLLGL